LRRPEECCFVVLGEGRNTSRGAAFQDEIRKRAPKAKVLMLQSTMRESELRQAAAEVSDCAAVVLAPFVAASAYRGSVALQPEYTAMVESLTGGATPVVMVAFGNPYLLRSFPKVAAYLATFSTAPTAELAAVKALFGEIPVQGRLPVSIPGFAKAGDGISLPR
jgi:beta-N-acetylhexosaminidase